MEAKQDTVSNLVNTIFKYNGGKLAKAINKVLIYTILCLFCVNVASGVVNAFNDSITKLSEKNHYSTQLES